MIWRSKLPPQSHEAYVPQYIHGSGSLNQGCRDCSRPYSGDEFLIDTYVSPRRRCQGKDPIGGVGNSQPRGSQGMAPQTI